MFSSVTSILTILLTNSSFSSGNKLIIGNPFDCLENSDYMDEEYSERSYRGHEEEDETPSRYGYRRYRRM